MLETVGKFSFLASRIPGFAPDEHVQVRNRTTGAAMSLLKKCDAKIVYL
jgi:hypothetical protein